MRSPDKKKNEKIYVFEGWENHSFDEVIFKEKKNQRKIPWARYKRYTKISWVGHPTLPRKAIVKTQCSSDRPISLISTDAKILVKKFLPID